MTADQNTGDEKAENIEIADAAEALKDSFEEMSSLTDELSGRMSEVADGFESFSKSTSDLQKSNSARIDPSATPGSTRPVADD